jgi:outer membrane lipoprotein-sorting protein
VALDLSITPLALAFGAVIVGIGIDDAVHILVRCPDGSPESVAAVLGEIGPILTLTTLSTALGFGSLGLSRLPVVSSLGLVIAVGVLACLVFALLLLPALLTLLSRRPLSRTGAILAPLLFCSLGAGAQDECAQALLERLEKKMEQTEAASCIFEQTKEISQIEGSIGGQGELLVQKPHFLKMTLTGDENLALYGNGETVWIVDQDLEEVTELPFAAGAGMELESLLPPFLFGGLSDLKEQFAVQCAGEKDGLQVLLFQPVNADTSPVRSMALHLDGRDRLRLSMVDYVNGDRVETRYRNWRALDRVSVHAFVFRGRGEVEKETKSEEKDGVEE